MLDWDSENASIDSRSMFIVISLLLPFFELKEYNSSIRSFTLPIFFF